MYIFSRMLCRKDVVRAFDGQIVGKSGNHAFPVRIKIAKRRHFPTLLTCARHRRHAHTQDDAECNCRKGIKHEEEVWAFIVPLDINKEADA